MKMLASVAWIVVVSVWALLASSTYCISVVGTVRGRKYVVDAETAQEFLEKIETSASLPRGENAVLYKGKLLQGKDVLSAIGVSSTDLLTVVRDKKRLHNPLRKIPSNLLKKMPVDAGSSQQSLHRQTTDVLPDLASSDSGSEGMAEDRSAPKLPELDSAESMETAMKRMLEPGVLEEFFADEDKLEKARLDLLSNIDKYEQVLPGFREKAQDMASDPKKWRLIMNQAKGELLKQRDAIQTVQKSQSIASDTARNRSAPEVSVKSSEGNPNFHRE
jgi:hypothetical protein